VAHRAATRIGLDPTREEEELRAYLGDRYDHRRLERWEQQLDEELDACGDEEAFYRTSKGYLYNLTAFAMSGTKLPYLRELLRHVPAGARLLDYGCGIGSDGLLLLEAGYRVEFADFENPSVAYLRWRLERRGLDAPVHDVDRGIPEGFDAVYAFDVLEHVPSPPSTLARLERCAELVVVNLLEPRAADTALHHPLPIARLVDRAASLELVSYRVLHGRSHLVVYRGREAGTLPRAVSRLRVLSVRARRALGH
jgi:SAM-dependent methyltransferase